MSEKTKLLTTPWWYWVVAIVAILYASAGLMQLAYLPQLPDPLWTKACYAIGQVFSGIGALGIVMRSRWARWFYLVSLCGFVAQRIWLVFFSGLMSDLPSYAPATMLLVIVVPLALIGFVTSGLRRNWLR